MVLGWKLVNSNIHPKVVNIYLINTNRGVNTKLLHNLQSMCRSSHNYNLHIS